MIMVYILLKIELYLPYGNAGLPMILNLLDLFYGMILLYLHAV